jgi:hypothetical protein
MTITANVRMWLAAGDYSLTLGVGRWGTQEKCDFIEDAVRFKVFGPGGILTASIVNLETKFAMRSDDESTAVRNREGTEVLS